MNIQNRSSVYASGEDCAIDLRIQFSKTIKITFRFKLMTSRLCPVVPFIGSFCCYIIHSRCNLGSVLFADGSHMAVIQSSLN